MDHAPGLQRHGRTIQAVAAVVVAVLAAGCGSSASPGKTPSPSPSPTGVSGQVSSALSQAGQSASSDSAASQASASASSALAQVTGGVGATADVQIGATTTDSGGYATALVTVKNPTADQHDYTISVSFKDSSGATQDVVVVSVDGVAAGATATDTARSNRVLSGVTAQVSAALRH